MARKNIGVVESKVIVRASADDCFCVASSYGVRLEWDPFVRAQRLVDADRPGPHVRTWTRSRHGLAMVSEYLSYRRPTLMGMKMVDGPALFRTLLRLVALRGRGRRKRRSDLPLQVRLPPQLAPVGDPPDRALVPGT